MLRLMALTAGLVLAAGHASAQIYDFTGHWNTGTGTITGQVTFSPGDNTITASTVTVSAGDRQMGGGPIAGATYTVLDNPDAGLLRVTDGPVATDPRRFTAVFNPSLGGATSAVLLAFEDICNSNCTGGVATRQSFVQDSFQQVTPAPVVTSLNPAGGVATGGTTVTITGTGLTGTTGVFFGGTAGTSVTDIDDTRVTVVTPARAVGVANVQVLTNAMRNANTAGDDFTYAAAPNPVPTLSEWAMILLGAGLAGAAALTIRRRAVAVS